MTPWITDRLPSPADADLHGQVRWGPHHPGLLCHWADVRAGEAWTHSSAWRPLRVASPISPC
jgi:hypothetical protein